MGEWLVLFLCGMLGGVVGSLAHKWGLERKTGQLEIEVYDLKERLLTEIKKRASMASRSSKHIEAEILEAAQKQPQPQAQQPWYFPYLKQSS